MNKSDIKLGLKNRNPNYMKNEPKPKSMPSKFN